MHGARSRLLVRYEDHHELETTPGKQRDDVVLGVKDKIQTIELPHELRAKLNSVFELLVGLELRDRSGISQAINGRNTAINSREQSVKLCALYHRGSLRNSLAVLCIGQFSSASC